MFKIKQITIIILFTISFSFLHLSAEGQETSENTPFMFTDIYFQENALTLSNSVLSDYTSHTNIPKTNFTGSYNVTLFANPDNAEKVIFNYLSKAQSSVFVSMYTISRPDFNGTLIDLKNTNPSINNRRYSN